MDSTVAKELYAGRRLFMTSPVVYAANDLYKQRGIQPIDPILVDPYMPAGQMLVIECDIPPEELRRLIFGPGDND